MPEAPDGDPGGVPEFFSNWSTYRAVLDADAMEHRAIYAAVRDVLAARRGPFELLDLGCGDATAIVAALAGLPVARYVGVDSALPVLDVARGALADSGIDFELVGADLLGYLIGNDRAFDVILASFSVHHLQPRQKREFLAAALAHLRPGGELLLVDVVRRDGETREQYVARYCDQVMAGWQIPQPARRGVIAHLTGYDFPEELATQPAWARELGFQDVVQFYRGGQDTQVGWRMLA